MLAALRLRIVSYDSPFEIINIDSLDADRWCDVNASDRAGSSWPMLAPNGRRLTTPRRYRDIGTDTRWDFKLILVRAGRPHLRRKAGIVEWHRIYVEKYQALQSTQTKASTVGGSVPSAEASKRSIQRNNRGLKRPP